MKGSNLLLGSASNSNFGNIFYGVIKGNWIDFEIEKYYSFYSGFKFSIRVRIEIQFLAIFYLRYKRELNWIWNRKKMFFD